MEILIFNILNRLDAEQPPDDMVYGIVLEMIEDHKKKFDESFTKDEIDLIISIGGDFIFNRKCENGTLYV